MKTPIGKLRANHPRDAAHHRESIGTSRGPVPRWAGAAAIFFIIAMMIAAAFAYFGINHLNTSVKSVPVQGISSVGSSEDPMNILISGSDERDGSIEAGTAQGRRSDSLAIVHISSRHKQISVTQIPRDIMIKQPQCHDGASEGAVGDVQINSLLSSGESCLATTVSDALGMPIHHFVGLNFSGFITMVDALDGIDMCLPESISDVDANLDMQAGCQRIRGEDALALSRTRHAVGDGSDLARIGHQQSVIRAIVDRISDSSTFSNPINLHRFLNSLTKSISVDENLKEGSTILDVARRVSKASNGDIKFVQLPIEVYPYNLNRVQLSDQASGAFNALKQDQFIDG